MNLDALRVKPKKDLKEEELQYLKDNKDKLSADELKKFETDTPETLSKEDKELLDAIRSGSKKVVDASMTLDSLSAEDSDLLTAIRSGSKKVVDAMTLNKLDKLDALEATAEEYRKEKANQLVLSHIARGALKPDQKDNIVKMLLSAEGTARKTFEDHLTALPSNDMLATEYGHKDDIVVTDVVEELSNKAKEFVKTAKEDGRTVTFGQAQTEVLHQDKDLLDRYNAYREQQNLTR